jgi:hypothetical protein
MHGDAGLFVQDRAEIRRTVQEISGWARYLAIRAGYLTTPRACSENGSLETIFPFAKLAFAQPRTR